MGLFRKKDSIDSSGLGKREEQLLSRITELEQFIETAPDRIRREMEEEITTMPAPDDLVDRRREHKFYTQLSRGEIRNERRYHRDVPGQNRYLALRRGERHGINVLSEHDAFRGDEFEM